MAVISRGGASDEIKANLHGWDLTYWVPIKVNTSGQSEVAIISPLETVEFDDVAANSTVVPTGAKIYGYDGIAWDRLRTTSVMAGGTIDEGLLAVGRVPPADPVEKIKMFTGSANTVTVWMPGGGMRWNLTDFVISVKNASDVTLYDGTSSTKAEFYLSDTGGVVMNLQTPFVATSTNTPLTISLTSSTLSITTSGYETP